MKFDRIDLWTMKSFLERIVTRGPLEEDVLVNLVKKIELQLEGLTHVNTGKTGKGSDA
jgi:hypothetical protein